MRKDFQSFLYQISLADTAGVLTGLCLAVLCLTRIYTTIAYRRAITISRNVSEKGEVPSPLLPYTIPWFGHTLRFFEKHANRWYPRQRLHPPHGIYSIIVAGSRTHIVTNAAATRHLFRHAYTGGITRENFVKDLLVKCLLVSPHDTSVINTGEGRKQQEEVFHKFLVRRAVVTELTSNFSQRLYRSCTRILDQQENMENVSLYAWLRKNTISTSLTTFFGEELLRIYPDICEDIFHFDEDLCTFFFGMPKALHSAAHARRQRTLDHLVKWDATIHELGKGPPEDPTNSTAWDPIFGSRFNKARLRFYDKFGICPLSRAGMNLSIMFALASNVIPAIGWMFFHILAGPESQYLLQEVRREVDNATNPDGTLDVQVLLSACPFLDSIWTEVIRHYCDNMVMRDVTEDTTIPLDDQGTMWTRVGKGDLIISPCWVAQHDPTNWQDGQSESSPEAFVPKRFFGDNLPHTKVSALAGVATPKMYSFGGGKSVCAGRVFAKEEAIVTVAQTLSSFDFEVNGFQDAKGKPTSNFPSLTPALPGVTIYVPQGDLSVNMRKRVSKV